MTQSSDIRRANAFLGYPDDARLLILNADDFGMNRPVNEGIIQSMRDGLVQSTSLMILWPNANEAVAYLRDNPDADFAVHLSVICDNPRVLLGPLTAKERVPSLVDEHGHFWGNDRQREFLAQVKVDELEIEYHAQIDRVLAAGLKPTHLDWHCIYDGGRTDVFEMTVRLAKEHGLAIRAGGGAHTDFLERQGLPANEYEMIDSYRLPVEDKAALYAKMLRELPAGLTEWAVHPAIGNAEFQAIEPDSWRVRATDYDFVMSAEARDIIAQEGIILLGYRAIQQAWYG